MRGSVCRAEAAGPLRVSEEGNVNKKVKVSRRAHWKFGSVFLLYVTSIFSGKLSAAGGESSEGDPRQVRVVYECTPLPPVGLPGNTTHTPHRSRGTHIWFGSLGNNKQSLKMTENWENRQVRTPSDRAGATTWTTGRSSEHKKTTFRSNNNSYALAHRWKSHWEQFGVCPHILTEAGSRESN